MSNLVPPHGGKLNPLLVNEKDKEEILGEAGTLHQVMLSSKEVSDLIMMAMGAFSPLSGFMVKADYQKVVREMRLEKGLLWPIPITISVSSDEANKIKEGQKVALLNPDNDDILAIMLVEEKYSYDKKVEARQVFRTDDENHPGVRNIY